MTIEGCGRGRSGFQLWFLLSLLFWFNPAWASSETYIYVSPKGSDAGSGKKSGPLLSVSEALRRAEKSHSDVAIVLRGGEYRLREPIHIGPEVNGGGQYKLRIVAQPGEVPVLSGCNTLYQKSSEPSRIPLLSGLAVGRTLFINGDFGVPARTPNADSDLPYLKVSEVSSSEEASSYIFKLLLKDPGYKKSQYKRVVINSHWYFSIVTLSDSFYHKEKRDLALVQSVSNLRKAKSFFEGASAYIEGGEDFIDTPDEFYFDKSLGVLHLDALALGNDFRRVDVPFLRNLVAISGSSDSPVRNVHVSGIVFECTYGGDSDEGEMHFTQFAQRTKPGHILKHTFLDSVLKVENAENIEISRVVVRNSGGSGVQFSRGVRNSALLETAILNVAGNAMEVDPVPREATPPSSGILIRGNSFYKPGRLYTNAGGLLIGNVSNVSVTANFFQEMPYICLQLGHQPGGKKDLGVRDVLVAENYFSRCMLVHDDGGAIYTLGGSHRGTLIENNVVENINRGRWAGSFPVEYIYLDNYTSGVTVRNNALLGGRVAELNRAYSNKIYDNGTVEKR